MTTESTLRLEELDKEALLAKIAELEEKQGNKYASRIPLDEYIPVMSLLPYRLNLPTKEGGNGDIKRFTKFGEVKNIMYKDLVDIMEVNRSFMEAGYFYILNPTVVRQHGLDEVYSKILTKEKIEEILNTNSENCIHLYQIANDEQQKIIIQLFIDRIKENPDSVNLNTVDKISRLSKTDILKRAEESKTLEQELMSRKEEKEEK